MGQGTALSIKARRQELGLTQAALARAAGVSLRTIKAWEKGEARPGFKNIVPLAAALQISLDQLAA